MEKPGSGHTSWSGLIGRTMAVLGLVATLAVITPGAARAADPLCDLVGTCPPPPPPPCDNESTDPDGAVSVLPGTTIAPLPAPQLGQRLYPREANGRLPYGFTENGPSHQARASATEAARIVEGAGGSMIRMDFIWRSVQPQRTSPLCFGVYDRIYKTLVQRGIRPIFIIGSTPRWATTSESFCTSEYSCQSFPSSEAMPEFRALVGELARRYPLAAALEIWNEPNLQAHAEAVPDPAAYAEVLAEAYDAIKQANPDMRVLAFAVAPVENGPTEPFQINGQWVYGDGDFVEDALQQGALDKFDGVALHPYPLLTDPNPSNTVRFDGIFQRVQQGLENGGITDGPDGLPNVRLVPDEFGFKAAPTNAGQEAAQRNVLDARYADLSDADDPANPPLRPAMATHVDAALFYSGVDPSSGSPFGWVGPKNILTGTFDPKEVYCHFRREVAQVGADCPLIPGD